jgi:dedicated sortase system histidine kinase
LNAAPPRRRFGIRLQVLLVLMVLLALPWLGYKYLSETDRFLRNGQERALRISAQAVATALYQRSDVFSRNEGLLPLPQAQWQADQEEAGNIFFVDPPQQLPTQPLVTLPPLSAESVTPSEPIASTTRARLENTLAPIVPTNVRLWVVNRQHHVLVRIGSLHRVIDETPPPQFSWRNPLPWLNEMFIAPLYTRITRQPTEDFLDDPASAQRAMIQQIDTALTGISSMGQRPTEDGAAIVVMAVTPIWSGDTVVGAVIAEETTNGILAAKNAAFERLFPLLISVILLIGFVIIIYATWLSGRIRALRNEVEQAVDARGRLRHITTDAMFGDEIGDLSRSFSEVLSRLEEAAMYREQMASRLSHELRTPIAVVRSSLENLREPLLEEERQTYLGRAQVGLERLSHILARMTEASRLEQSIMDAERAEVDLCALLKSSVEGYRQAYPRRRFELRLPEVEDHQKKRYVAPDLLVQMLDKLIANANEFGTPDTAVNISLQLTPKEAVLRVTNEGPLPPEGDNTPLFEPMVSMRSGKRSDTPHLGLGLYIVRLITEFHGGNAKIAPRDDALGTVVTVRFKGLKAEDQGLSHVGS